MVALAKILSQKRLGIQSRLFPWLDEELGELSEKEQELATLELIRTERFSRSLAPIPSTPPTEIQPPTPTRHVDMPGLHLTGQHQRGQDYV